MPFTKGLLQCILFSINFSDMQLTTYFVKISGHGTEYKEMWFHAFY